MKRLMRIWGIMFLSMCLIGWGCNHIFPTKEVTETTAATTKKTTKKRDKNEASFTFMGVGDNLLHDVIFRNNDLSLKNIDYDDIYSNLKQYTNKDINYINYETICAGTDNGLELSGYPSFNGPAQFNDAVANAGFNWFSLCSNHTYDMGTLGVETELDYIHDNEPDVTVTGAYKTKKESEEPTVINVNGIKVGLASYCYGFNSVPEDAPDWMVNSMSKSKIKSDMKKLNEVSDVQIVSMHWGTEYSTETNEEQEEYAKLLNELGVEVIIGAHPHVIEPVEWIHGKKQDTLCYYSLGNLISAQNAPENMVGGMADFELTYNFDTKKAKVTNAKFIPTITYYDSDFNNYALYTIHEWNDDLAATHEVEVTEGQDISVDYVRSYVKEVMKGTEGVEIVLK